MKPSTAKLALEALQKLVKQFTKTPSFLSDSEARCKGHEAIAAIEAELAQPVDEFTIRGRLASSLTYWHQLTGQESQELVDLFAATPAAQPVEPGINQLTVQLHDDQKWTVAEQQQFAEFLKRFPNESSQGIMSLGDAWKHGKACAAPQEPAGRVLVPMTDEEIDSMWQNTDTGDTCLDGRSFARAIEAHHSAKLAAKDAS